MRILTGAVAAAALLLAAPVALAHQGNPHYRTKVDRISPTTKGISVDVLNFDDRLELLNTSGKTVVIDDYKGKPYARILPDRTVQVNTNSEAYYLNDDRYADVDVPKGLADTPKWKLVSRTARFEWHDHRMHWMGKADPPQLKDKSKRTHIFDWQVPITVDGHKGAIAGTLTWVPLPDEAFPMAVIWISAVVLIGLSLLAFWIRRRRDESSEPRPEEAHAW